MKKIAVIMSVYKNDKLEYLKECLESLYNQTYKNFDIFIQCDGIIPKEIEDFLDLELQLGKIKYLGKRDENKGLAYSLNELLNIVLKENYEYIARMDADDIAVNNRFELQYNFMEKNRDIDVCGGFIEEFNIDTGERKMVKYPLTHDEMFKFFKKRVPIPHPTAFFRNSFFKKAGFYKTYTISNEDTILWLEGFKNNCIFANLDKILVKMRVSNNFYNRRTGYKKVISDFKDRIKVNKELAYGIDAYLYAVGMLVVNSLPPKLKRIAYKYLR